MRQTAFVPIILLSTAGAAPAGEVRLPTHAEVKAAVDAGIAYLLSDQNKDGSWGGPQDSITTWSGPTWSSPEDHRAWKVATTGLCVAALVEVGTTPTAADAADRGIRYLIANPDVRRPGIWSTMNNWAYIYGLQGLCVAYGHSRHADSALRPAIAAVVPRYLDNLARYQSLNGGWGYLEFDQPRTRRPQWGTSFMTAAAVVAVEEARRQGFAVDAAMVARAVRAIHHCRLPNGGYTYAIDLVPNVGMEYINQVKGSLSRIQVCHAALLWAGEDVAMDDLTVGLAHFFHEHKFLDIAVHKPVPHETYYFNSGYFYLFGHYYAALVIERAPKPVQAESWSKLCREIMKLQQADGSIWDYDMHRYDKPYGVAFGVMALGRALAHPEMLGADPAPPLPGSAETR